MSCPAYADLKLERREKVGEALRQHAEGRWIVALDRLGETEKIRTQLARGEHDAAHIVGYQRFKLRRDVIGVFRAAHVGAAADLDDRGAHVDSDVQPCQLACVRPDGRYLTAARVDFEHDEGAVPVAHGDVREPNLVCEKADCDSLVAVEEFAELTVADDRVAVDDGGQLTAAIILRREAILFGGGRLSPEGAPLSLSSGSASSTAHIRELPQRSRLRTVSAAV